MNQRIVLPALAFVLFSAPAHADGCKYKAQRAAAMDADGVTAVEIFALAGDLKVRGHQGATQVKATGNACTSREDMLEAIDITVQRHGDEIRILAEMPDISGETNRKWKNKYAIMDLDIELPDTVSVSLHDSSGDLRVSNVSGIELTDSSGDIKLENIHGNVLIPQDSSGDISMKEVGAVTIQVDSSGEIDIEDADSVTIANDTSGDITLQRIQGNVLIGNDSSGRISVREIGGNFVVENDTSGGIRYAKVSGSVNLPDSRHTD